MTSFIIPYIPPTHSSSLFREENEKLFDSVVLHFFDRAHGGGMTRDDLISKMSNDMVSSYFFFKAWNVIEWNRYDDKYCLTPHGHSLLQFIDYFNDIFEFIHFIKNLFPNVPTAAEELELQLTMAGKHRLLEQDTLTKIIDAFLYPHCNIVVKVSADNTISSSFEEDSIYAKRLCRKAHDLLNEYAPLMNDVFNKFYLQQILSPRQDCKRRQRCLTKA